MLSLTITPLVALASLVAAQVTTKCNPLTTTCPADPGIKQGTFSTNFVAGEKNNWVTTSGTINYGAQGAEFTVRSAGDSPVIQTDFYIFFGYVEAKIRAAPGTGIVSSLVFLSDALDEIDWEWLGGRPNEVQTNYFGKGNTTTYDRATWAGVPGATTGFHTYAVNWTPTMIQWIIDGNVVRTLNYGDAVGGRNFPQTPARVSLGIWAGGASPNEGTVEWAGGRTDFSQGPFTMYVDSVKITNYNPAGSYQYTDNSGSYQNVQKIDPVGSSAINGGSGVVAPGSSSAPPPTTTTTIVPSSPAPPSSSTTTSTKPPTTTINTTSRAIPPTTQSSTAQNSTEQTENVTGGAYYPSTTVRAVPSSSSTQGGSTTSSAPTSTTTTPNAAAASFDGSRSSGAFFALVALAFAVAFL